MCHTDILHKRELYVQMIQLCRLEFLAEFTSISISEMKLNTDTFRWIERMPPILEEHVDIITRSRREAEEGLKVCVDGSQGNSHHGNGISHHGSSHGNSHHCFIATNSLYIASKREICS